VASRNEVPVIKKRRKLVTVVREVRNSVIG